MRVDYDKDQLGYALAHALKERNEAKELAKQMSESNQVLMADVRHYRQLAETPLPNNELHLKLALDEAAKMAKEFKKERDEAMAEIEGWRNKWDCAITMAAQAEIERDEARSHIAEGWTVKAEDYDKLREAAIAFMNKVTSRISLGMLQNIEGEYNNLIKVTYGRD